MIIPIQFVGGMLDADGDAEGSSNPRTAAETKAKKPQAESRTQRLRKENQQLKERIASLEADLSKAQAEVAQYKADAQANFELAQRKQAESENTRKRVAKEQEQFRRYANEALLVDFFPVLDSLRQALSHAERREDPLAEGLAKTAEVLARALKKHGVTPIDETSVPFDAARHSALNTETRTDYPDNTVIEVYAPGYMLADRVIKPALVRVAVGGPPAGGDGKLDAPESVAQAEDADIEAAEDAEEPQESGGSEGSSDEE
jgi:molecular chaperone GrpE